MSSPETPSTFDEWARWARQELAGGPSVSADVGALLCSASGKNPAWLIAHGGDTTPKEIAETFISLVRKRESGIPVAYLTGYREFWSLMLKVTPDVLIPRHETELLVERALTLGQKHKINKVVDLGTGSGAIALALASEQPHWHIDAVDISAAAIAIANENQQRLQCNNAQFYCGNWFSPLPQGKYDLIISNPPYIREDDPHLSQGDLIFEPVQALVAVENGLADLSTIAGLSRKRLKQGGWVIMEHGYDQGKATRKILREAGFSRVATHQDLAENARITEGYMA